MKRAVFLFLATIFPFFAGAQVVINEVGWAGTKASASDEWLELYNDSESSVNLDGWILRAKDGTPQINLSGNISVNGFYLIERTADTTISNVKADYVGSFGKNGNLSNNGEDLELVDKIGVLQDKVYFSLGWPAGSPSPDYVSMERVDAGALGFDLNNWKSNNGKKINGKDADGNPIFGTPKAENSINALNQVFQNIPTESASLQNSESSAGNGSATHNTAVSLNQNSDKILFKENRIKAYAGEDRLGISGADIVFEGNAAGLKDYPLDSSKTRFIWNFGDGAYYEGKTARHSYFFPGSYIAVLDVVSGEYEASDRITVKVLANEIAISEVNTKNGWIKLYNNSSETIDVSFWQISLNEKNFVFPKNTFFGGKKYLVLPKEISGLDFGDKKEGEIKLLYPNGSSANSFNYKEDAGENNSFSVINKNVVVGFKTPGKENLIEKNSLQTSDVRKLLPVEKTEDTSSLVSKFIFKSENTSVSKKEFQEPVSLDYDKLKNVNKGEDGTKEKTAQENNAISFLNANQSAAAALDNNGQSNGNPSKWKWILIASALTLFSGAVFLLF